MQLSSLTCFPLAQPPYPCSRSWIERHGRDSFSPMASAVAAGDVSDTVLAAEEERLARAAAAGDGNAFATLYERYERRAYNLAYRVTGSEDDAADAVQDAFLRVLRRLPKLEGRELAFGSYLFTATRNASYDLIGKRKRAEPSDAIPEAAAPIGAAAGGGFGLDPSGPDEDPDRKLLIESQQEEIRAANERLPERQREALALRELEELSYDEIAAIMDMNRNSVAQLISRARIKLRDELRVGALASIAMSSPDCERALPLIAMRDDGQLSEDGDDAVWLDDHLSGCHTCRLGMEAMQEAGASYRAWAPVAAAPWLFKETLAKAAELTGSDWSETIAERSGRHDPAAIQPGMPSVYRALAAPAAEARKRRRRIFAAAGLGAAALLAIAATVLGQDDPPPAPAEPAAKAVETVAEPAPTDRLTKKPGKRTKTSKGASGPARQSRDSPDAPTSNALDPSGNTTPSAGAPVGSPIGRRRGPNRAGARIRQIDPQPAAPRVEVPSPPTPPATPPTPEPAPDPPPVEDPPVEPPPVVDPVEPPPTRDPGPTNPPPGSGPPIL